MTMSQVLQQQSQRRPNNIQYIINTKPQGNEDVQFIIHDEDDYKAESSQTVYTPPKIAHPALIRWESSPEATPQVPTTEIKYAQHIDALQYFPPSNPQPNLKIKPLKEKIQKSPIPNLSLMFLGKHGPSFPVFTSMMKDLHHAMETMVGNPLEIFNGQPSSILTTMKSFLYNFLGASYVLLLL
ncbi:uncharacterized protein [Lepeophtheirus salmonis]|uniref:uncharacterized protein n=1 Tax=Lepeophtheirus salmonis TaxID=72036 RepID=UPI003AF3F1B0